MATIHDHQALAPKAFVDGLAVTLGQTANAVEIVPILEDGSGQHPASHVDRKAGNGFREAFGGLAAEVLHRQRVPRKASVSRSEPALPMSCWKPVFPAGGSMRKLVFGLCLLMLFAGPHSVAEAQSVQRRVADTGIVTLGPGQLLRVTVASASQDDVRVRVRRLRYLQGACRQGACTLAAVEQATGDPITVIPGRGFSIDIGTSENLRAIVTSDSPDVRIKVYVMDATTGQIIAILIG